MKLQYVFLIAVLTAIAVPFLPAQDSTISGTIFGGIGKGRIALPDFRGKGAAQPLMNVFNETVWNDIADAGILDMVAKTSYPLDVPQSPADLRPPTAGQPVKNGMWLTDWSGAPVNTNYLGIGYVDVNGSDMVLRGSLLNVGMADLRTASTFANNPYFGPVSEDGARKIAHEYAADILKQMGMVSLAGTKIYFVSDRTGTKEIWSMDYDGQNQRQMTRDRTITQSPSVSPDGKMVAYATMVSGENAGWQIRVRDADSGRQRTFLNPGKTSIMTTPEFSPDGSKLWFSMEIDGWQQLAKANLDGSGRERVSQVRAIEVSPRLNPKTGGEVLFISGRTSKQQLYKMNANGSGVEMITTNDGEVANPSWSPDGRKIAFSWTKGYDPGNFNIFVMDMSRKEPVQLTRQNGSNENPTWAPDGVHLVYSNKRGNSTQIYSMLANGTRVKQLTSSGNNAQPVWAAKGTN
jgi:TolB protein